MNASLEFGNQIKQNCSTLFYVQVCGSRFCRPSDLERLIDAVERCTSE